VIPINKWAGLVTNASQYAIPPGAAVEQVNLQCLIPGQLTVRPGMTPVTLPVPSTATTSIVRAFRYQHGSAEHIVYQDAQGNIYSSVVSASTAAVTSPPAAPTITSALPGNTNIYVSLTAPAATGGSAITGYSFQVSADNGTTWSAAGSSGGVLHLIMGLTNGTGYRVRAAATNASGQGDYSSSFGPVSPRAPAVGPASPPSLVSANASAFNTATVSWYTPTDNGGSAITGYSIQQSSDRGLTWSTSSSVGLVSTAAVSGLAAGTDFVFRVAAITSYGTGQYSAASNSVSIVGATTTPSQPQNLSGVATTTSVTLSWGAPTSDGGTAITGYSIRYGTSSQGPWTVQSAAGLTGTVTGLSTNTRYTFGVYASNANGGGQIASLDVTTLAAAANTAPSSPTNLVLTATADGFSATWDAPASTGGSAITAYRLTTASSQAGPETQVYNSLTRAYTATGLTAGSTVLVSVYAINAVGTSTSMRSSVTIGLLPSAPRNFTATPTNTQVTLSWLPPASLYGQPVTGYVLNYGNNYGEEVAGNATSKTLVPSPGQPFVAGASYTYTIAAITAAFPTFAGATASVTFTVPAAPAVPPSAPRNLVLTPTDSGFIASWDAPATAGDPALVGYKTYVLTNGAWVLKDTRPATSRNYQATGYPLGTAISVRVTAYSPAAESVPAEGTVTPYALPSAPQSLTYSMSYPIVSGQASVSLSWDAPSSLGGLALKRYVIYKNGAEFSAAVTAGFRTTQSPGTATYAVYAETAAGLSPSSNTVTVTAVSPTAPNAPTLTLVSRTAGQLQFTAYSGTPPGAAGVDYAAQFSLDSGTTWQAATASLSATADGAVRFVCDVAHAGSASRAVLARAMASVTVGGTTLSSDWSSPLSASVTFSPPVFAPAITSTELSGGKVRILWTAPTSTGGAPITNYSVVYSGTGVTTTTYSAGTSLQFDLTRQTNTAASIVVRATNAIGTTSSSAYTLPAVIPAPGWDVVEVGTGLAPFGSQTGIQPYSDGTVKLRASHPPGINWQTIAFYRWQSSPDQVTWTTLADTPTADDAQGRAYTATSQPAGLLYYRSLASVGGTLSSPSPVRQKPTAPGVVRALDMSAASMPAMTATVSWTGSLYDGGRAISAYELQASLTYPNNAPVWQDTVEHSVATYGAGPYSKTIQFPFIPSGPYAAGPMVFRVRVRAAVSRDFSDPIRAGQWTEDSWVQGQIN
jgi:titin